MPRLPISPALARSPLAPSNDRVLYSVANEIDALLPSRSGQLS